MKYKINTKAPQGFHCERDGIAALWSLLLTVGKGDQEGFDPLPLPWKETPFINSTSSAVLINPQGGMGPPEQSSARRAPGAQTKDLPSLTSCQSSFPPEKTEWPFPPVVPGGLEGPAACGSRGNGAGLPKCFTGKPLSYHSSIGDRSKLTTAVGEKKGLMTGSLYL